MSFRCVFDVRRGDLTPESTRCGHVVSTRRTVLCVPPGSAQLSGSGREGAVATGAGGEPGGAVERLAAGDGLHPEAILGHEGALEVEGPLLVGRQPVVAQAQLRERGDL